MPLTIPQREIVNSHDEIADRLSKLNALIGSDAMAHLPSEERGDIYEQKGLMEKLEVVLRRRRERLIHQMG